MLDLLSILNLFNVSKHKDIKIYRHSDQRFDQSYTSIAEELYHSGQIESYQSIQSKHVLGDGLVAFFIGETRRSAKFIGVWKVQSYKMGIARNQVPQSLPFSKFVKSSDYWYDLQKDPNFDELIDRLVVQWPQGRSAHRWLQHTDIGTLSVPVLEIRGIGFGRPFPGFDDLFLTFAELKKLVTVGDGGTGWEEALSSTRGVYLISDIASGSLYVGSATGARRLWQRWTDYAKSGHGENVLMDEGIMNKTLEAANLRFSILETLGNLASPEDGKKAEVRWKRKLGKNATVLNGN